MLYVSLAVIESETKLNRMADRTRERYVAVTAYPLHATLYAVVLEQASCVICWSPSVLGMTLVYNSTKS